MWSSGERNDCVGGNQSDRARIGEDLGGNGTESRDLKGRGKQGGGNGSEARGGTSGSTEETRQAVRETGEKERMNRWSKS